MRLKEFVKKISNEKSDIWVKILKITALVELGLLLFAAILMLLASIFDHWNASGYIVLCLMILIGAAISFIVNMVIVNALHNLQEIRKAVTKEDIKVGHENEYECNM